jgi:hypothetical protein
MHIDYLCANITHREGDGGIESKIEETVDSQYMRVAFAANPILSGIECKSEFAGHEQGYLERNR